MAKPRPEKRMAEVVSAVGKLPDGASFIQAAAALNPPATKRNVQRWLGTLVREKKLIRVGNTRTLRYKVPSAVPTDVTAGMPCFASPAAQAIHCLVTQPQAERTPADYRRIFLDCYRPNETR